MTDTPRQKSARKTDAQLLRELEDLGRRVHETAETVREGRRRGTGSLLGRAFPMPGMDDARRLLLDQMRDGACILSADGNVIVCNRAFAHILDRPAERIVGAPLGGFLKPADRPSLKALIDSGTRVARAEISFLRPDRSERRVAVVSERTLLYGFKACCMVTRDLTEERNIADIVGSDELARVVFDQANEAIVVCDPDGAVLRANRRAAELAAEGPDLKRLADVFPLMPPGQDDADGKSAPVDVLAWLRAGAEKPLEARLNWRGGGSIQLLLNAGPIRNAGGEFLGWVVTFSDISSHVEAEKERRRAGEREQELIRSLQAQAEQLREKNRELEQFALTASHDLQEPLRKINSFGDLLQESFPQMDARSRDYLDRMKRSANRMSLLIDDLLQYARASGGKDAVTEVDASAVARDVVSQLDAHIEKSGMTVDIGALPTVRFAKAHLHQLLLNLIGNAVKYRRTDNPRVTVSAERQEGGWRFAVADNGIGIEEKYHDRIFRIFERLHSRNQYLGTGIGLAICKTIVERRGGRIWVESEVGKGSTFYFTVPDDPPSGDGPAV